MKQPIDLFPARIAIGMFYDSQNRRVDVTMTPEFFRALRDVLMKLGGPATDGGTEIFDDILAPLVGTDGASGVLANETSMVLVSVPDLHDMVRQLVAQELTMLARPQEAGFISEMTMGVGE